MSGITVIKRDIAGDETWRYIGQLLKKSGNAVLLEALFNLADTPFMGTSLKRGDRFVELFYTDRWYNIFEVHDRDDDSLKGWYCNISKPAIIEGDGHLSFIDLALDLWVSPSGVQTVLDEDDFAILDLDEETRRNALQALKQVSSIFISTWPFQVEAVIE